jgi:hypothetical protein
MEVLDVVLPLANLGTSQLFELHTPTFVEDYDVDET